MQFVILTAGCLAFTLFVAAFSRIGRNIDRKRRRLAMIGGKAPAIIDEELEAPLVKRFILPVFYGAIHSLSRFLPRKKDKEQSKLEKDLTLAGLRISPNEFVAMRWIYVFAVLVATFAFVIVLPQASALKIFFYLFGIIAALLGPARYLKGRIKHRQEKIRRQMPDILDLFTVSVEAGLSFDGALVYINQYAVGPLVAELGIVKKEIQMGLPRREALKNLAERNSVEELKTFVGALVQSEQIGIPLRNVLRAQASALRMSRKNIAEEKAMKAPVKMTLPLVVFVFPVTFIILLGPTVLNLIKTFS